MSELWGCSGIGSSSGVDGSPAVDLAAATSSAVDAALLSRRDHGRADDARFLAVGRGKRRRLLCLISR